MIQARWVSPAVVPADLLPLRTMAENLPPPPARFSTIEGQDLLKALRAMEKSGRYSRRELAAALGVSPQTIQNWLQQRIIRKPRKWPGDDDLRELRVAARVALAMGRRLRRQCPEWGAVHTSLSHLQECGFEIHEIALALDIPTRRLRRFEQPQLPGPTDLSRSVRTALPHVPRQEGH